MRALLARAALALLVAAALFAVGIARLRRVPRPRFEPVASYAGGRVQLGRVVLARRGAPASEARLLGWSVLCDGREVIARPGAQPLRLDDAAPARPDALTVRTRDGASVGVLAATDCSVRRANAP